MCGGRMTRKCQTAPEKESESEKLMMPSKGSASYLLSVVLPQVFNRYVIKPPKVHMMVGRVCLVAQGTRYAHHRTTTRISSNRRHPSWRQLLDPDGQAHH